MPWEHESRRAVLIVRHTFALPPCSCEPNGCCGLGGCGRRGCGALELATTPCVHQKKKLLPASRTVAAGWLGGALCTQKQRVFLGFGSGLYLFIFFFLYPSLLPSCTYSIQLSVCRPEDARISPSRSLSEAPHRPRLSDLQHQITQEEWWKLKLLHFPTRRPCRFNAPRCSPTLWG